MVLPSIFGQAHRFYCLAPYKGFFIHGRDRTFLDGSSNLAHMPLLLQILQLLLYGSAFNGIGSFASLSLFLRFACHRHARFHRRHHLLEGCHQGIALQIRRESAYQDRISLT